MNYENNRYTGPAAAAVIAPFLRVTINGSGQTAIAGIGDVTVGVNSETECQAGDSPAIVSENGSPALVYVAAKAIAVGDTVYPAASGKVTDTAGTEAALGKAATAAAADGDQIRVLRSATL
jgi:predicted RecA/RadA family phage recombinase